MLADGGLFVVKAVDVAGAWSGGEREVLAGELNIRVDCGEEGRLRTGKVAYVGGRFGRWATGSRVFFCLHERHSLRLSFCC